MIVYLDSSVFLRPLFAISVKRALPMTLVLHRQRQISLIGAAAFRNRPDRNVGCSSSRTPSIEVPYAEESFRTIEHESAAPRSFSTMGLLASSYSFQCRRNVVDGVIKRPFKCVFLAPGRRIPSLMHAILLCESEVILNCGIDIHSAIGDSHY